MSIKLHGHPQLAEYTDPSQMPDLGIHMNWAPGENPVASPVGSDGVMDIVALRLGNSQLGHAHMNLLKPPLYGEITAPFQNRFSIVVFNAQGQFFLEPKFQGGIRDFVWDATGSSTPPPMIGAIGVEKTWTGTLTFDPTMEQQFKTLHGWWNPGFTGTFRFDNGDEVNKLLYPCFYSLVDPSVPESFGVPFISARVSPHDVRHHEEWGDQLIETLRGTQQWLPVAPLKAGTVYHFLLATNGYGAVSGDLPPAIVELRRDSDIHHHGGGAVIEEITAKGIINLDVALSADLLGPGLHKFIAGRRQKGLFSDAGIVTQLVFNATVEGTVTPPTLDVVPNVVGLTQAAATNLITAAGLMLGTVTPAHDALVPAGSVISQSPAATLAVAPMSLVAITVSLGPVVPPPPPTTVAVPDVVGQMQADAKTRIEAAGLMLGAVMTQNDATITKGNVMSQSPSAGTKVSPMSAVALMVSSGPIVPPPTTGPWEPVPTIVKRLKVPGGLDRFCLCVAGETLPFDCVELVVKPDPEG